MGTTRSTGRAFRADVDLVEWRTGGTKDDSVVSGYRLESVDMCIISEVYDDEADAVQAWFEKSAKWSNVTEDTVV